MEGRIQDLAKDNEQLRAASPDDKLQLVNEQLKSQLAEASARLKKSEANNAAMKKAAESYIAGLKEQQGAANKKIAELSQELEGRTEKIAEYDRKDEQRARLLKRAMKLEGRVRERKVLHGNPRDAPQKALSALGNQLGFEKAFKSKGDAMKAIRQRVAGRKGAATGLMLEEKRLRSAYLLTFVA